MKVLNLVAICLGLVLWLWLSACGNDVFETTSCVATTTTASGSEISVPVECPTPRVVDIQGLQENLDTHRQLWERSDINHYCFSERYSLIALLLTNYITSHCISNGEIYLGSRNIEYHFSNIQIRIVSLDNVDLLGLSVVYNTRYGYPSYYGFTEASIITDGGGHNNYHIEDFQIKK